MTQTAVLEQLVEIQGLAAECVTGEDIRDGLLPKMCHLFRSKSAVHYDVVTTSDTAKLGQNASYEVDPFWANLYSQHFQSMDPCYLELSRFLKSDTPPSISTDQVIRSEETYVSSEYYNDFLNKQNIHSSIIFYTGDSLGAVSLYGFHRSRGAEHYDRQDHLIADLLNRQLAAARRKARGDSRSLRDHVFTRLFEAVHVDAYLVLDTDLHIVSSGGEAASELALTPDIVKQCAAFQKSNGARLSLTDTFPILEEKGGSRLVLEALDTNPALLLLKREQVSHTGLSAARLTLFGLSNREREVVGLLSLGQKNAEIAATLGLSVKTVENHLISIFRKTDSKNRTGLLRRLSD